MNSTQWTTIISAVIVVLGQILNYLKTRTVAKAVVPPTPPTPPK